MGSSHSLDINGNVWACSICFFSNKASIEKCELCGVKRQYAPTMESPITPAIDTGVDSSICTVCTFMNHPSMIQCEMCSADLPREIVPTSTSSTSSLSETSAEQIKLSFRSGGQSGFQSHLKTALSTKQWEMVRNVPVKFDMVY
jgi:ESCRT-II complex subunit VPS36